MERDSIVYSFAYDMVLVCSDLLENDLKVKLNSNVRSVASWLTGHLLSLNTSVLHRPLCQGMDYSCEALAGVENYK